MLKRTTLRCSSTRRHNITTVEDPRGYWGQINIFFVRKLWVDNSITLEISTGLLDGINFGFFYSRIRGFAYSRTSGVVCCQSTFWCPLRWGSCVGGRKQLQVAASCIYDQTGARPGWFQFQPYVYCASQEALGILIPQPS